MVTQEADSVHLLNDLLTEGYILLCRHVRVSVWVCLRTLSFIDRFDVCLCRRCVHLYANIQCLPARLCVALSPSTYVKPISCSVLVTCYSLSHHLCSFSCVQRNPMTAGFLLCPHLSSFPSPGCFALSSVTFVFRARSTRRRRQR